MISYRVAANAVFFANKIFMLMYIADRVYNIRCWQSESSDSDSARSYPIFMRPTAVSNGHYRRLSQPINTKTLPGVNTIDDKKHDSVLSDDDPPMYFATDDGNFVSDPRTGRN